MQLIYMTWKDVEEYLKTSKTVLIPVGSTEQHGPTGLIGTDAITAEDVAIRIGKKNNIMVGPTINVGMSYHHTGFPGSISLRPTTLINVIRDYVQCLAKYGFNHFFFVNGHGGNEASIQCAMWELYRDIRDMNVPDKNIFMDMASWFNLPDVNRLRKEFFDNKSGSHATASEISVTMFTRPEYARSSQGLAPCKETRGTGYGPEDFRKSFPDGRINSSPELATPEYGEKLLNAAVDNISEKLLNFIKLD